MISLKPHKVQASQIEHQRTRTLQLLQAGNLAVLSHKVPDIGLEVLWSIPCVIGEGVTVRLERGRVPVVADVGREYVEGVRELQVDDLVSAFRYPGEYNWLCRGAEASRCTQSVQQTGCRICGMATNTGQ